MPVIETRLQKDQRYADRLEHWRRAVAADPSQYSRLLAFGTHLWTSGQTEAARPLLELFVSSAPAETYGMEVQRLQDLLATSG